MEYHGHVHDRGTPIGRHPDSAGQTVGGPVLADVGLPDRQDRRRRGHAREANALRGRSRDDPRHERAMSDAVGIGASCPVQDVNPVVDASGELTLAAVDARVDDRHRDVLPLGQRPYPRVVESLLRPRHGGRRLRRRARARGRGRHRSGWRQSADQHDSYHGQHSRHASFRLVRSQ